MELRQLEAFLAVIDHGSFSAAAEALFTVQSNVSSHVARLERDVGTALLDRRSRRPTAAGEIVEVRARAAIRELAAVRDDLAGLEDRIVGAVAIGTTPAVGMWVIPRTMGVAHQALPEVEVSVFEAQSDELVQRLVAGELHLAVTTGASNPELEHTPLFDEDIVAVLAEAHPLADREVLTIAELAATRLLLPHRNNPLHAHLRRTFERAGFPITSGLEVGSSSLVSAIAGEGVGVALLPATAAASDLTQRSVRRPVHDLAPREVALTRPTGLSPSRAVEAVATIAVRAGRTAAQSMPGCRVPDSVEPGDLPLTSPRSPVGNADSP